MAPAIASTVATFRNTCSPYHGTGPAVNQARYIAQHLSPYHTGARLSGRRYIPKYLYLAQNGWRCKHPTTVSDIQRGAQLASQTPHLELPSQTPARGKRYKRPVTSKGEELAVTSKGEELAAAGKGEELARQSNGEELARRVRVTNAPPRVRVKNRAAGLVTLTARLIRGFYGKQFFIPSTISIPYMISDTNQWGLTDKFSLYEYKCTTENENHFHPLDTTLAGP